MTKRGILAALLLAVPGAVFASGDTVRISISGPTLATPVEITDGASGFQVWAGPGTTTNESQSLIVNWAGGTVAPPSFEPTYEVRFHTTRTRGPKTYLVLYKIDPATVAGYVYIPGKDHPAYAENTWLILHKVEGRWFRAWSEWEKLAHPLIAKARK